MLFALTDWVYVSRMNRPRGSEQKVNMRHRCQEDGKGWAWTRETVNREHIEKETRLVAMRGTVEKGCRRILRDRERLRDSDGRERVRKRERERK